MTSLGSDFHCDTDLTPDLATVSEGLAVAQSSLRRLQSFLWYDSDYGYPLAQHVNAPRLPAGLLSQRARAEVLKDERVADCGVSTVAMGETSQISGTLDTGEGPFDFTLQISALSATALISQ